MRIIPKSEWGGKPATKTSKMPDSALGWIVHYNGPPVSLHISGAQMMLGVQRYHQVTKGWRDFAYSFGISQEGEVFEGRGWNVVGGHTSGRFLGAANGLSNNSHAHAVFFMIGEGQPPSQAALDAFAWLVNEGTKHGVPKRTTPHKIASPTLGTACPGTALTAITKSGYFLDTVKEPDMTLRETVRRLYIDLLGREPDAEGWDYWSGLLNEKAVNTDDVRWEFIKVRLAATDAKIAAIAATQGTHATTADVTRAGDQAFRDFLNDLAALVAAQ